MCIELIQLKHCAVSPLQGGRAFQMEQISLPAVNFFFQGSVTVNRIFFVTSNFVSEDFYFLAISGQHHDKSACCNSYCPSIATS